MKHKGNTYWCNTERAKELTQLFISYTNNCDYIEVAKAFQWVVNQPATQFYVSQERATVVITQIINGDKLQSMHPNKREMFQEIYNRYVELRKQRPHAPLNRLIDIIIKQPAPKFYLKPDTARIIVYNYRKQYNRRQKLLAIINHK